MFVTYPDVRYLSGCSLPIQMYVTYPDANCPRGAAPIIDKRQGQPYPFRMQFPRDYFKF